MSAIIDNFASRTFKDHWNEFEPAAYDTLCHCGKAIKRGEWCMIYFNTVDNGFALVTEADVVCMGCHHDSRA